MSELHPAEASGFDRDQLREPKRSAHSYGDIVARNRAAIHLVVDRTGLDPMRAEELVDALIPILGDATLWGQSV